jgi:hypothetical protein
MATKPPKPNPKPKPVSPKPNPKPKPRPINPGGPIKPPKPTGPRKDGKAGPKPKAKTSGGFGRAEDQITRAIGSYINTAGTGIRGAATGVDKLVVGIGKAISSAYSGGAAPGTFMGPAPKPKPKPKPKPDNSTPIAGGYTQRWYPDTKSQIFESRAGKRRTQPRLPKLK